MTSSGISTSQAPHPPARARRVEVAWLVAAAATVPIFVLALLYAYRFRPTPSAAFLVLGWIAILGAAFLLTRAVFALDPAVESAVTTILSSSERERQELMREKQLLLKAIKEVEFDQELGKIDGEDAKAMTAVYRARALEILQRQDGEKDYRELVETELAKRHTSPPPSACACGTQNDKDAVFCKTCGAKLGGA
jgi:hypothetical protein